MPYDPDHLFACGVTSNGEYLFWTTEPGNKPTRWQIAVNEARGPVWFTHDGTTTNFLASVLTGWIQVPQFSADLLQTPPAFTPSNPVLVRPAPLGDLAPGPVDALGKTSRLRLTPAGCSARNYRASRAPFGLEEVRSGSAPSRLAFADRPRRVIPM
ncbi:hypothetical protein AB0O01_00220 [Streptomyces sp. NPDC093252]|uniref:hypothetical protein n=1 Tax=Streptomyces sp. NPDC093252 TaxID=3154980 RepID=UPI003428A1E7